jgi:hypothetical protein
VTEPVEDKLLEDYLRRKSAISMGYKRIYVEAPPPELDRAVKARAERALRWLVPALISATLAFTVFFTINAGIHKWMDAMVSAERNLKQLRVEQQERERKEALEKPIVVAIDASSLNSVTPTPTREAWLAEIAALRQAGKQAEADAEQQRMEAAFPDEKLGEKKQ